MAPIQPVNGDRQLTPNGSGKVVSSGSTQTAARVSPSIGEPDGPPYKQKPNVALINGMSAASGTPLEGNLGKERTMRLELEDGTMYDGFSFGANKSAAGELVFQTGMVGYPESITDPSYEGQILVVTFPLVGNYGVPSRETADENFPDLPAHFEANQIHVSGLVVASYSEEDYSHHLAQSSLGKWLKEQGIPAIYGVDTRALTKQIRREGSMLGKILVEVDQSTAMLNGHPFDETSTNRSIFECADWTDPNTRNLVADGESVMPNKQALGRALTFMASLRSGATHVLSAHKGCFAPSIWPSNQGSMR